MITFLGHFLNCPKKHYENLLKTLLISSKTHKKKMQTMKKAQ